MKLQKYGAAAGAGVLAAVALAGCGSDNNSSNGSSGGGGNSAGPTTSAACPSGTLTAAGSTAQQPAIAQLSTDYQGQCTGVKINYNANGSGAGYTAFTGGSVDFAGSDYPLSATQQAKADERCGAGNKAIDIPGVAGGIAVIYNLQGVTDLKLSAKTAAGIFNGEITKWDDQAIKTDNPSANLPSKPIQVFSRSDGSGTSFNFSTYLHALNPTFPAGNKAWPGKGSQAVSGSKGVAQGVKGQDGSIGYVDLAYATPNHLNVAALGNAQGQMVPATTDNTAKFLANAATATQNGKDTRVTFNYNYSDPSAYPAPLITYEFVCATGNKAAQLPLIKGFWSFSLSDSEQSALTSLGYVKMPPSILTTATSVVASLS